jgi:hypothetical protein
MALKVTKKESESWRQCVERYAGAYGLEHEALTVFESELKSGREEPQAAFYALYEWDLLDFVPTLKGSDE